MDKTAKYYYVNEKSTAFCELCPVKCKIRPGFWGNCRARYNKDGVLLAKNYGLVTSLADDPIEKKPLYHFYPGSKILSLGSFGCNLHCRHCQNWQISQNNEVHGIRKLSVSDLIYFVRESGHMLVAFTYNEPLVWYEYVLEASQALKKLGVKIVLVTNGYINPEPLQELLPYIDAHSLDIKWALPQTAQRLSKMSDPGPVFEYAKTVFKAGQHLEIVTNLVDGYNDSDEELTAIARFIVRELSPDIPWHISRSFPAHQLKEIHPTPIESLKRAQTIGQEQGLRTIHLGNL